MKKTTDKPKQPHEKKIHPEAPGRFPSRETKERRDMPKDREVIQLTHVNFHELMRPLLENRVLRYKDGNLYRITYDEQHKLRCFHVNKAYVQYCQSSATTRSE